MFMIFSLCADATALALIIMASKLFLHAARALLWPLGRPRRRAAVLL